MTFHPISNLLAVCDSCGRASGPYENTDQARRDLDFNCWHVADDGTVTCHFCLLDDCEQEGHDWKTVGTGRMCSRCRTEVSRPVLSEWSRWQPQCAACWIADHPGLPRPERAAGGTVDTCCTCGLGARHNILVDVDPSTVSHPTRRADRE
jgi:hypothetical protein